MMMCPQCPFTHKYNPATIAGRRVQLFRSTGVAPKTILVPVLRYRAPQENVTEGWEWILVLIPEGTNLDEFTTEDQILVKMVELNYPWVDDLQYAPSPSRPCTARPF